MITFFRNAARKNLFIRKLIGYHLASSGFFDAYFRNYTLSETWQTRIDRILESTDNHFIPKVERAGHIQSGKQIMHNGIPIYLGSYYGPEYSKMLSISKGIHEPQEERVFMEALKTLPKGAVMIEMGAFWSFYSIWFHKEIEGATNYMIEPDDFNLGHGRRNFKLNGIKGHFVKAFIGQASGMVDGQPLLCIDDFVAEQSIPFIHMLHSDIQGHEFDMLRGAEKTFEANKIGYVFISTHSNEVHEKCLAFLKNRRYVIIAEVDLNETYSEDGLIAARSPNFPGIDQVPISVRKN